MATLSLGALRLGLGWFGRHNGVKNIAGHLKSLHTRSKWVDNAFYGDGCPYFGRLIQYYWLGMATLTQIKVCFAAIMMPWQQVRGMETSLTPQIPLYVSLNDGWGHLKRWIGVLMAPHTHTPVQAGPYGNSQFGGSEAGFGLVWPA